MATAQCPICESKISVAKADIVLHEWFRCSACRVQLEIISASPFKVATVAGQLSLEGDPRLTVSQPSRNEV